MVAAVTPVSPGAGPATPGYPPVGAKPAGPDDPDDELWRQRRRVQNEEMSAAVERARQRREEEERKMEAERKGAAQEKLKALEERLNKPKDELDKVSVVESPIFTNTSGKSIHKAFYLVNVDHSVRKILYIIHDLRFVNKKFWKMYYLQEFYCNEFWLIDAGEGEQRWLWCWAQESHN